MGRPKGIPNKPKLSGDNYGTEKETKETPRSTVLVAAKPKVEPLQVGQKYFETPDGELIIGEADKQQVWSRRLNGGKGGWVNPQR